MINVFIMVTLGESYTDNRDTKLFGKYTSDSALFTSDLFGSEFPENKDIWVRVNCIVTELLACVCKSKPASPSLCSKILEIQSCLSPMERIGVQILDSFAAQISFTVGSDFSGLIKTGIDLVNCLDSIMKTTESLESIGLNRKECQDMHLALEAINYCVIGILVCQKNLNISKNQVFADFKCQVMELIKKLKKNLSEILESVKNNAQLLLLFDTQNFCLTSNRNEFEVTLRVMKAERNSIVNHGKTSWIGTLETYISFLDLRIKNLK